MVEHNCKELKVQYSLDKTYFDSKRRVSHQDGVFLLDIDIKKCSVEQQGLDALKA